MSWASLLERALHERPLLRASHRDVAVQVDVGQPSDITQHEPEADACDLGHCWLMVHLDDPRRRCIGWPERCVLAAGFWWRKLTAEASLRLTAHPLADGFNATNQKRFRALHDRGIIDGYLGGLLPRSLGEAGLGDVTHEGIARIVSGGSAWSTYLQETWRLIDGGSVEEGLLSAADVAASRQAHVDPTSNTAT
jgi:hypothetical protein